jgi:alkylated DNA repair dioxygenase AlkB
MPTVKELQKLAKERDIKNYSKMRKAELCEVLKIECDDATVTKKRVKINKPECIGDRYEWVVGKGCFEKTPKAKTPPRPKTASAGKIELETPDSALVVYELDDEGMTLLKRCKSVVSLLDKKPSIKLYGKTIAQPRNVGFFSDVSKGYKYSSSVSKAKKMTPELTALLNYVNKFLGASYNGILVNQYESGNDYISKHSDDEKGLDPNIGVVSMSLGAVRKFRIRDKVTGKIVIDVPTLERSMIQMAGNFQNEFTHEVPKQKRVPGERVSFTFRYHVD